MANNDLGKRFFTNTYITGAGRQNYLRIDELEDPLFTSFTLDIDFVSSPLFYTINYSDYGYPNIEGMADEIETALISMHSQLSDDGYDILPQLSASILDGNKLGYGLQQNVYLDTPLYGATEYIYMVDKRNGSSAQNDARYDNNKFIDVYGTSPQDMNSYKLGDSVKNIVNESDRQWAKRQLQQNNEQMLESQKIMENTDVDNQHKTNYSNMEVLLKQCNDVKGKVEEKDGIKEYTEAELQNIVSGYKKISDEFEQFNREIVDWANGILSQYRNRGNTIYMNNKCIQKIATYDNSDKLSDYINELKSISENWVEEYIIGGSDSFANKFLNLYNELETYVAKQYGSYKDDDGQSFLIEMGNDGSGNSTIRQSKIIEKFRDKLKYFGLLKEGEESFSDNVIVTLTNESNESWITSLKTGFDIIKYGDINLFNQEEKIFDPALYIMRYKCDLDTSFDNFGTELMEKNEELLAKYQAALDDVRTELYGFEPGAQEPNDMSSCNPESKYGQYLAAKEIYENDEYSQAEKANKLALSGVNEMSNMIIVDDNIQNVNDKQYNSSIKNNAQPEVINRKVSVVAGQSVLDILGFISGMKKMIRKYPYIIQGVTGLDVAYNKHYGIKDPYLGSGDDKITLTCLESLDLRVSSMFNRYFNAIYDRQYRRERVPVNLRRFNCSIYVHDVRNFVTRTRYDKYGDLKTYNKLLELTDMYYSAIEFRFYDCEIVPEETGNIFNDVSNEAPSEMKKTNFTFTYGNCVVNFVPQSEVAAHNSKE